MRASRYRGIHTSDLIPYICRSCQKLLRPFGKKFVQKIVVFFCHTLRMTWRFHPNYASLGYNISFSQMPMRFIDFSLLFSYLLFSLSFAKRTSLVPRRERKVATRNKNFLYFKTRRRKQAIYCL